MPPLSDLLAEPSIDGWSLLFALLSILAGWVLSIFAKRGTLRLLTRVKGISDDARLLIARIVKYTIVLLGVGVAFAFLGASVQPLLVIAIIVAAITFLALRGISDNFAAGMILQTRQPIKVGDEIEIQNNVGIVRELNGRSVILETWDGRVVHVPNVKFLQEALYNHSDIGHRRSDLQVRAHVPPERVADVIDVITTTSLAVTGVLTEPSTRVFVIAVGPGEATLLVRFWHRPLEGLSERSASVLAIGTALTDANIEAVVTSDLPDAPFSPPFPV